MMPRVRPTTMPRLRPARRRVGTAPAASVATPPPLAVRRAEEVMRHPARVLTDDERTQYLEHGYVALPSHISHECAPTPPHRFDPTPPQLAPLGCSWRTSPRICWGRTCDTTRARSTSSTNRAARRSPGTRYKIRRAFCGCTKLLCGSPLIACRDRTHSFGHTRRTRT